MLKLPAKAASTAKADPSLSLPIRRRRRPPVSNKRAGFPPPPHFGHTYTGTGEEERISPRLSFWHGQKMTPGHGRRTGGQQCGDGRVGQPPLLRPASSHLKPPPPLLWPPSVVINPRLCTSPPPPFFTTCRPPPPPPRSGRRAPAPPPPPFSPQSSTVPILQIQAIEIRRSSVQEAQNNAKGSAPIFYCQKCFWIASVTTSFSSDPLHSQFCARPLYGSPSPPRWWYHYKKPASFSSSSPRSNPCVHVRVCLE